MLSRIIDYGFRRAYRLAWPFVARYRRYRRQDGVCIAVWAQDRVLVVRHSYKPGLGIPGGGLNTGEDPCVGGLRELREEVGISVPLNEVSVIYTRRYDSGTTNYFCEVHLLDTPKVIIDRREIIYAEFLSPAEIILAGCDRFFATYLTARSVPVRELETA